MEIFLEILAIIAAVLGIVGSVVPALPGPPVSWLGLLLLFILSGGETVSRTALLVWLGVVVVVTVLDYILPSKFTSLSGGHKAASKGAIIGLFAGLFIPPVGMIVGSMLGAFIAELLAGGRERDDDRNRGGREHVDRERSDLMRGGDRVISAVVVALGAFAGFVVTTGMKLLVCILMAWKIVAGVIA